MTVIFDLDYTLLDTARFKDALADALEECGITRGLFLATYESSSHAGGKVDYDPRRHVERLAERLSCSGTEALARLEETLSGMRTFLFPRAEDVLRALKDRGTRLVLFTHGNVSWQRRKVERLGIGHLFDDLLFTPEEKKASYGRLKGYDGPVVMVNDNGTEIDELRGLFPEFTMIAVRGPKPPPTAEGVIICDTLETVLERIKSI